MSPRGPALLTGVAVLIASAAFAQSAPARVSVTAGAGLDLPFSLFNTAAQTSGIFGTEQLLEHSYRDVFAPSVIVNGGVAARISPRLDLLARARLTHAAGREHVLFGESISRNPPASRAVFAAVSDYRSVAVEAGVRRRWAGAGRIGPYIGATAGFAFVDAVRSDYACPSRSGGPGCGLTTASAVPVFAGLAGLSIPAAKHVGVEIEAAIRWQLDVAQDPSIALGFVQGSFTGQRVSVPVTGAVCYRF